MASTSQSTGPSTSVLPTPSLPIPQLESLKFKANQIIDSIYALQRTVEAGGHPGAMPAWPDILSKYSMLLSQTHNFSNALVQPFPNATRTRPQNVYETIALHPGTSMADTQLDGEVAPLLRNQQTTDVLRMENDTVRRLAEHMNTRGSPGVLGVVPPPAPPGGFGAPSKPEYEDVLKECAEIRGAHDQRVERAVRAVLMLREKFDWKQRVEVEVEEPEELDWDPRLGRGPAPPEGVVTDDEMGSGSDGEENNSDEDDEFNVEGELVNAEPTSPAVGEVAAASADDAMTG